MLSLCVVESFSCKVSTCIQPCPLWPVMVCNLPARRPFYHLKRAFDFFDFRRGEFVSTSLYAKLHKHTPFYFYLFLEIILLLLIFDFFGSSLVYLLYMLTNCTTFNVGNWFFPLIFCIVLVASVFACSQTPIDDSEWHVTFGNFRDGPFEKCCAVG